MIDGIWTNNLPFSVIVPKHQSPYHSGRYLFVYLFRPFHTHFPCHNPPFVWMVLGSEIHSVKRWNLCRMIQSLWRGWKSCVFRYQIYRHWAISLSSVCDYMGFVNPDGITCCSLAATHLSVVCLVARFLWLWLVTLFVVEWGMWNAVKVRSKWSLTAVFWVWSISWCDLFLDWCEKSC